MPSRFIERARGEDWPQKPWRWRIWPIPLAFVAPFPIIFISHDPGSRDCPYRVFVEGGSGIKCFTQPTDAETYVIERLAKEPLLRFDDALKLLQDFPSLDMPDYSQPEPRESPMGVGGLYRNPEEPPVMLAETWEPQCPVDPNGYWMSEKLDGVRAYWNGKQLISRAGNVFMAPDWFTECFPKDEVLDGELFMGRGMFNQASGIVRRHRPHDGWKFLTYLVFDLPTHKGTYEKRQADLEPIVQRANCQFLRRVPSLQVTQGSSQVIKALDNIEALGGEGVMLVKPGSKYQPKRTWCMMKVKSWHDDEGTVLRYQPGKGRHKGRMGALWVRDATGLEFKVGGGFSDAERDDAEQLFPVGSTVTFRFFERTPKGKPRFPKYLRVRAEEPGARAFRNPRPSPPRRAQRIPTLRRRLL